MSNFKLGRNIVVVLGLSIHLCFAQFMFCPTAFAESLNQHETSHKSELVQKTASVDAHLTPRVFVQLRGKLHGYVTAPRLSLLVFQAGQDWYWPSAQLYKINTEKTQQLEASKQEVMEQLRLLTLHWHLEPQIAQQFMALRRVIAQMRIGEPIPLVLDPDALAIRPELDKALDIGHYVLEVHKKMDYVTFVGLGGEQKINQQADLPAYAYLDQLPISGWRESDEVWLVQSRAALQRSRPPLRQAIPVASWNKTPTPLPIGALLFVPISDKYLPEPWQDLNQRLLNLMEHRIFP